MEKKTKTSEVEKLDNDKSKKGKEGANVALPVSKESRKRNVILTTLEVDLDIIRRDTDFDNDDDREYEIIKA